MGGTGEGEFFLQMMHDFCGSDEALPAPSRSALPWGTPKRIMWHSKTPNWSPSWKDNSPALRTAPIAVSSDPACSESH